MLQFDPQKTDVGEHIDLIDTLGDMIGQKDEAKLEKWKNLRFVQIEKRQKIRQKK